MAEVGGAGVAEAESVLAAFVGVVGGFDAASDFVVLGTAADTLSFLSSTVKTIERAVFQSLKSEPQLGKLLQICIQFLSH